jgi:DNA-directed RNA polymerase specialized sigma24 family protein
LKVPCTRSRHTWSRRSYQRVSTFVSGLTLSVSCDARRLTGEVCGRPARSGEFSENSPHLQGAIQEQKSKKQNKRILGGAFGVPLTSKQTACHAPDAHSRWPEPVTRDPMEKPDPYGEWVLHQNSEASDSTVPAVDQVLLAAARAAWPRVLAHARLELRSKNSEAETEALAAEVWESVLKSVVKALQRKRDNGSQIANLEGYLFASFHHRFNRFLKSEQRRDDAVELVASSVDFDQIASAHDTRWASELETAIAIKEVIRHMDGWTRKIWQARQYGYSWKEISTWLGVTEQQAKMKFRYGLGKTRQSLLGKPKRKSSL